MFSCEFCKISKKTFPYRFSKKIFPFPAVRWLLLESRSWFSNKQSHYLKQFLQFTRRLGRVFSPTRGYSLCIPHHNKYYAVITAAPSFSFRLFIQLAPLPAGKQCFHLFPCNFTRICIGFLRKSLWFFSMVFDGNPTHFFAAIVNGWISLAIVTKSSNLNIGRVSGSTAGRE